MSKKKPVRTRGKIQLSKYFQKFKKGDSVAVVIEPSVRFSFPKRIQGRTGVIEGERGRSYITRIKEMNCEKIFIIDPIHLKKIRKN